MNDIVKAAIIEDEQPAARLLMGLVRKLRPSWDVVMIPGSISEASLWFEENSHPDLLFLDIQLSDGNSFDLVSKVRPQSMIIFTTAFDEYALRAFSVSSIDYILKPVDEGRLNEALSRFETLHSNLYPPEDYIETILDALKSREKRYRTRFLLAESNRYVTLKVSDISYFFSENRITTAVTFKGGRHIIDFSLSKLEDQLDPAAFFRANRKMLVSVDSIAKIEPYFNGKIVLQLTPPFPEKVTVSEERTTPFKMWLDY